MCRLSFKKKENISGIYSCTQPDECANLSYVECLIVCCFDVYLAIFKLALVDPAKAPFSKKAVGTEVLCGCGQLTERECFRGFGNRGAFFRRFDT